MNRPLFIEGENIFSYEDLCSEVALANKFNSVIRFNNFKQFLVDLLTTIIYDQDIALLDDQLLTVESETTYITQNKKVTVDTLQGYLLKSNSSITLYTSGTTGNPKAIKHTVKRFVEMSKIGEQHKNSIWAFLYNPTHMAGIQVLFQALLNNNSIIYMFGTSRNNFLNKCNQFSITNLSATPTFYRLLAPYDFTIPSIKNVTLGGERADNQLLVKIKKSFPAARINNVYASTEAGTILVSKGDIFSVEPHLSNKVKIDKNEIFIHADLLGSNEGVEWFATGDIIEFVDESKSGFRIVSRTNDIINVGGNRINLIEIEKEIMSFDNIVNVRVYSKSNSVMGKIVAADLVISSIEKFEKREFLRELSVRLPAHMVPMSINIVDELTITNTGKISRK